MVRVLLFAGLAAAALTPTLAPTVAFAQPHCLEQRHENQVVGTILGAGVGAILGGAVIVRHGGSEGGAIIGGVGGAVAGNAIASSASHCGSNQYGYYDDSGRWIPNTATAYGYYDPDGHWVQTASQDSPPPPPMASGPAPGGYDQDAPRSFPRDEAREDTRERENHLQARIERRIADGALDERQGRHATRDLEDIRRIDADYRSTDGRLNPDQRRDIDARLDALDQRLRADRGDGAPAPPAGAY
jgi:outer membrane lipoprotein SlyB